MKKITLVLMLAVAAVMQCNAQLLWKVTGNGLSKPSYIFGTFHVAPVSIVDSVAGLDEAMASVEAVYGELALSELHSAPLKIAQTFIAPADSTLGKVFTEAELQEINSVFSDLAGVTMDFTSSADGYKPVALSSAMLGILAKKSVPGYKIGETLDEYLLSRAVDAGKYVGGLESLQKQIDLLYSTPISQQAADLLELVRMNGSSTTILREMYDAYKAGDIDGLYEMISDSENGGLLENANDRLLKERNEAWVEFLLGFIPTTSVLVVCGAGHLPGADGLISLLRGAGYSVEPVN